MLAPRCEGPGTLAAAVPSAELGPRLTCPRAGSLVLSRLLRFPQYLPLRRRWQGCAPGDRGLGVLAAWSHASPCFGFLGVQAENCTWVGRGLSPCRRWPLRWDPSCTQRARAPGTGRRDLCVSHARGVAEGPSWAGTWPLTLQPALGAGRWFRGGIINTEELFQSKR